MPIMIEILKVSSRAAATANHRSHYLMVESAAAIELGAFARVCLARARAQNEQKADRFV